MPIQIQHHRTATPFYIRHMDKIKISAIDHFIHESETWERALNFCKQENAYLKTRLSQVVDNNTDKEFVIYESSFSDILGIIIFNFALFFIAESEKFR